MEIERVRQRGFGSFRDTVLCINAGSRESARSCDGCLLLDFVPPEGRQKLVPCNHIPLDSSRRTVDTLSRQATRDECGTAVLHWMEQMLAFLEEDLAVSSRRS
jgi:hypothetical protein